MRQCKTGGKVHAARCYIRILCTQRQPRATVLEQQSAQKVWGVSQVCGSVPEVYWQAGIHVETDSPMFVRPDCNQIRKKSRCYRGSWRSSPGTEAPRYCLIVAGLDVSACSEPQANDRAKACFLTSRDPLVPTTESEKRNTVPAKVTLMLAGVLDSKWMVPTTVSGGGKLLLRLIAVADAFTISPRPAHNKHWGTSGVWKGMKFCPNAHAAVSMTTLQGIVHSAVLARRNNHVQDNYVALALCHWYR